MPQPDRVMALPVPEIAAMEGDAKALFDKCMERFGMVPNVLRAYSVKPKKLMNFIRLYNEIMLGESGLSKLEREMIAVVVSSVNRCYYCLVAHGQATRQLSADPQLSELLGMNHRVAELGPRQRAMLDFAWKLAETPYQVGEADREALRKAGFSNDDIFDICDVVGFFSMSNRMASGLEIMPNPEYHRLDR